MEESRFRKFSRVGQTKIDPKNVGSNFAAQIWLLFFGVGVDLGHWAGEMLDLKGFGRGQTWIWEAKRGQIRRPNGPDLAQKIASGDGAAVAEHEDRREQLASRSP